MHSRIIYVATGNPGKLRDFAAAAGVGSAVALGVVIAPMPCLDRISPPPENEPSFEGNACAKAIYYSRLAPSLDILADDSGLEVDALHGDPGVRSARYSADASISSVNPDKANNELLLKKLAGVPDDRRTARYRCVLTIARDGKVVLTSEGTVEGRILSQPRGSGGFGYDPLFYLPELCKTMAEIDLATKTTLSHRGLALQSLFEKIKVAG